MTEVLEHAEAKSAWVVAVLTEARVYSRTTLQVASNRLGRKSSSFVKDIESSRFSKLSLTNALALCEVYGVELGFILSLYPPKPIGIAALSQWFRSIVPEDCTDSLPHFNVAIRESEEFRLRATIAKHLSDEYPHLSVWSQLGFAASIKEYESPFSH